MVSRIIELTGAAIILAWVLNHGFEFSSIANASTSGIIGAVRAIQGRP